MRSSIVDIMGQIPGPTRQTLRNCLEGLANRVNAARKHIVNVKVLFFLIIVCNVEA